jgi:probable HAF family extracellular repeat protein
MRTFRVVPLFAFVALAACDSPLAISPGVAESASSPALEIGPPAGWTATTLALPAGIWTSSGAKGINDAGVIVGYVTVSGTKYRPVKWVNGVPSFMVVTTSSHWAIPNAINGNGDAVGRIQWISGNLSTPVKPARWLNPGTIATLSTLGYDGWAMDINTARTAVGTSRATSGGQQRAVKWNAAGTITSLHPPGATWSRASGINDLGEIVGVASFPDGVHGWKWKPDNSTLDLGLLLNETVREISNNGIAIGTAVNGGVAQAVQWIPNGIQLTLPPGAGTIGVTLSDGHRSVGTFGSTVWTSRSGSAIALPLPTGAGWAFPEALNRCGTTVGLAAGGTLPLQVPVRWTPAACDP